MNSTYGKIFVLNEESEFGIIREISEHVPENLINADLLAEDGCGNYFILKNDQVVFWDHETSKELILANSVKEFSAGCIEPPTIELESNQVESVWVDSDFAKEYGIEIKP